MEENLKSVIEKRIQKTMLNLEKHNMKAFYVENKDDVLPLLKTLMPKGKTITCGGSVSLQECGIIDLCRNGDYNFLDRNKADLSMEEVKAIYRGAFCADTYLMSSNAITENGELYNVDGNANRVAALTYGPDSVIIVAGYNKIVADLDAAIERVKKIAAPANTARLHCDTPCAKTGECMNCSSSNTRICCTYTVHTFQRVKDRIKVILVGESLGY